jgi:hypothetical protein
VRSNVAEEILSQELVDNELQMPLGAPISARPAGLGLRPILFSWCCIIHFVMVGLVPTIQPSAGTDAR